ncbi:MAG: hypothetical protein AAFQ64_07490 [Pseudomonadota bacterium]
MKRLTLLATVVALAGCENGVAFPDFRGIVAGDGPNEASDPTLQVSDRDRVIAAVEANGCVISSATVGPIMTQASVNRDQLFNVSQGLEAEGALAAPTDDGTVRLISPNCPTL